MNKSTNSLEGWSDEDLLFQIQMAQEVNDTLEFNQAFTIFFERFKGYIFVICYKFLNGDKNLAEDLCLEIFQKINEKAHTFKPEKLIGEKKVKSWIGRIANNHLIDLYRNGKNKENNESQRLLEEEEWNKFAEELQNIQEIETVQSPYYVALENALQNLSNKKHKLIFLACYRMKPFSKNGKLRSEDLEEIAHMFDTTTANVKKIRARIWKELEPLAKEEYNKTS